MTPLRIAIDGRSFSGNRTGVGRYSWELARTLDSLMPEAEFLVYANVECPLPVSSPRWTLRAVYPSGRSVIPRMAHYLWSVGRMARSDGAHVFWATNSLLPWRLGSLATVVTAYDLVHLLTPETMDRRNRLQFALLHRGSCRRASRLIAISQGTADRIQTHYGIACHGVAHPAIDRHFTKQTPERVAEVCAKHGLNQPYVLCVGTLEPRKRLELAIRGFVDCHARSCTGGHMLAIVGARGWRNSALQNQIAEASANAPIKILGFVDDADLPALYTGASFLFFPSMYEGFGIPVLEAGSCGTGVVAANLPEIGEASGPGAVLAGPDESGLLAAYQTALLSPPQPAGVPDPCPNWQRGGEVMAQALRAAAGR